MVINAIINPIKTKSSEILILGPKDEYKLPNCQATNPKTKALTRVPKKVT